MSTDVCEQLGRFAADGVRLQAYCINGVEVSRAA